MPDTIVSFEGENIYFVSDVMVITSDTHYDSHY